MAEKKQQDTRVNVLALMPAPTPQKDCPTVLPDIPEFQEAFPVLNAFFTVVELNGKPRKTPTITLWVEGWGIKAVLADRENKRKLWLTTASLGLLWADLDQMLQDPNARWMSEDGTRRKR